MAYFRSAFKDCNLKDLSFFRKWYTWEMHRNANRNVRERVDCNFATKSWSEQFHGNGGQHLHHLLLDHYLIMITIERLKGSQNRKGNERFRFDAMWMKEKDCEDTINLITLGQ